jgi:hypothetical protein
VWTYLSGHYSYIGDTFELLLDRPSFRHETLNLSSPNDAPLADLIPLEMERLWVIHLPWPILDSGDASFRQQLVVEWPIPVRKRYES